MKWIIKDEPAQCAILLFKAEGVQTPDTAHTVEVAGLQSNAKMLGLDTAWKNEPLALNMITQGEIKCPNSNQSH